MLKAIRQEKGISKNHVFEESGVDVSKYESGKSNPKIESILILCDYYGIDIMIFWMVVRAYRDKKINKTEAISLMDNSENLKGALELVYQMVLGVA